ncbi:MAG: response regulator [Bacteroidota bacterium]
MHKSFDKIVLIDDDETINYYHNYMIEKAEIASNIITASDVEEALVILQDVSKTESKGNSLILLDINMPKYSGFELLEKNTDLFDQLNNLNFHVIILTTSGNPFDIERSKGFELIKEYIQKPITEDILHRIANDYA